MVAITYLQQFNRNAVDTANSFGGLQANPNPSQTSRNDQYDAYRHALMSAKLTEKFGTDIAKGLMDKYEEQNPNDPAETNMDLWNNNVGREQYEQWKNTTDAGNTTDSLEKWIYDAVKNGQTINDLSNSRSWIESTPFPDSLFPPYLIFPDNIQQSINDLYNAATAWFQPVRRDPLTLDLDGDGLETLGINTTNPILFDHDGDGTRNATGWVLPDDGFLVLDRNGNGSIDNGRELFGDSTPLSGGGLAALAQEDTNGDGKVSASDTRFTSLRIWRDLNQDGISQSSELFTLTSLNIAAINIAKTEHITLLANGNQIADLGTFIKTDGSEGTLGNVTGSLADIDLAENPFYREFTDTLPLTLELQALPDMQGSGSLRDLREAA